MKKAEDMAGHIKCEDKYKCFGCDAWMNNTTLKLNYEEKNIKEQIFV